MLVLSTHNKRKALTQTDDFIDSFIERVIKRLRKSTVSFKLQWYLRLLIGCPIVIVGVRMFLVTRNGVMTIIMAFSGLFIPELVIGFLERRGRKNFEPPICEILRATGRLSSGWDEYFPNGRRCV